MDDKTVRTIAAVITIVGSATIITYTQVKGRMNLAKWKKENPERANDPRIFDR